jgi:hypothetical protein
MSKNLRHIHSRLRMKKICIDRRRMMRIDWIQCALRHALKRSGAGQAETDPSETYSKYGNFMSKQRKWNPEKGELAMIEGILEGSPDAVGVAVIRLDCGCRKMAAVDQNGDPASKIIMYRDQAEAICEKCKEDQGNVLRVTEQFIAWTDPEPPDEDKKRILAKVLGVVDQPIH